MSSRSGSGKYDRDEISLVELFEMFPNDEVAEKWFEEVSWGNAGEPSHCPMCGSLSVSSVPSKKPLPYWCSDCRSSFSVRTNSVMHRSKIPFQKWAIAVYLWSVSLKGVSSMRLHRDLKITQKSAYFMAQRLRECSNDNDLCFDSQVEVD